MSETRSTAVPSRYEKPTMDGVVVGNYRLISQISSGGMGTVYRAKHEILGRPAAVKLLRPELTANEELVERFLIEAKAATKIRHPGIVEVYDFGYSEAGFAYLVMELLEGKPLGKALADVERFSEWEAANIARGIASALKAAHGQGIVHRDLKPDNVFLVPDLEGATGAMRPKVLDFGIAKLSADHQSHHTQTGALIGTPLYMAPEQARAASAIDHRADLYSLGCILYELLAGRPPFQSEGAGELIALHMFAEPEPLTALIADISPEMNALVMKLLAKEPRDRFQTAQEVHAALAAMLGGRLSNELAAMSSAARPVVRVPTTVRESKPTGSLVGETVVPSRSAVPIIAAAVTLAIAAAIAIIVVTTRSGNQPRPPDQRFDIPAKPGPPPTPPRTTPGSDVEHPITAPTQPTRDDPKPTKKPPPVVPGKPNVAPPPTPPKPRGPLTPDGSPMETDLEPTKKKEPK